MSVRGDVDRELRFHLDLRVDELISQGLSSEDARERAVAEFGDVEAVRSSLVAMDSKANRRDSRLEWFNGVWQDLSYAARALPRTPTVSLTVILTLALGIGANTAMFSLLDAIYLRPPEGVTDAASLRRVWSERRFVDGPEFWSGFDYASYAAIAEASEGRADATIYRRPRPRKLAYGENAPTVNVSAAASNYFHVLGIRPLLGRFYQADEDGLESAAYVAVISESFWKSAYGGSTDILGTTIELDGHGFTIIGVARTGFRGVDLDVADVWLPLTASLGPGANRDKPWWRDPRVNGFQVLLRPAVGVSDGALLPRLTQALRRPDIGYAQDTLAVAKLGAINAARGPGNASTEMNVATRLGGVSLLVLLIAVANVVNLLLARAITRRREIAVRLALGIPRSRLIRLLVTESVLLSIVATVAALIVAWWGGSLLRTLLLPGTEWNAAPLHWRVMTFALGAALLAGTITGLVPALRAASPDITATLKAGARAGALHHARLRSFLVATQTALSVMLLVGAVLFVRSLRNVKSYDIGYDVDRLVFATATYDSRDSARRAAFPTHLRAIREMSVALPGVENVALASTRPTGGFSSTSYYIEGDTVGRRLPGGIHVAVSPEFFATAGMRFIRGHTFDDAGGNGAPPTVIVNQAMARALWPGQDAIGQCMRLDEPTAPCATVIGVVQTAILSSVLEQPRPQFYVPLGNSFMDAPRASVVIVRANPRQLASVQVAVRELVRTEFPGGVPQISTMAQAMAPVYRPWDLGAKLFTLFGALALVVAAIGTYSTVSYTVSQRSHEFGIRIALGARTADVIRQVVGEGVRTALIGVAAGIILAMAAGRLVAALLFGTGARDPITFGMVATALMMIATAASIVPALRAARTDPMAALREE